MPRAHRRESGVDGHRRQRQLRTLCRVQLKRPKRLFQRADGVVHVLGVQANNHGVIALARELGLVDPLNVGSNIQLARMNLHGGCIRVAAQRDLGLQLIEAVPVSALLPRLCIFSVRVVSHGKWYGLDRTTFRSGRRVAPV